jgi:hypothetical protein
MDLRRFNPYENNQYNNNNHEINNNNSNNSNNNNNNNDNNNDNNNNNNSSGDYRYGYSNNNNDNSNYQYNHDWNNNNMNHHINNYNNHNNNDYSHNYSHHNNTNHNGQKPSNNDIRNTDIRNPDIRNTDTRDSIGMQQNHYMQRDPHFNQNIPFSNIPISDNQIRVSSRGLQYRVTSPSNIPSISPYEGSFRPPPPGPCPATFSGASTENSTFVPPAEIIPTPKKIKKLISIKNLSEVLINTRPTSKKIEEPKIIKKETRHMTIKEKTRGIIELDLNNNHEASLTKKHQRFD